MQALQQRDPDLSVIVPVYNLEKFLQPLLDSLKRQDLEEYKVEYIFVLNNCTDNSEAVLRASGLDCKILSCDIQGCGPARNVGFDEARGKYVWFMDGDDWLLSEYAIRDALDRALADNLDILRIRFASNSFNMAYFSMVWQYVLRREFVADLRFPAIQPCEDDVYMEQALAKLKLNRRTYICLPTIGKPLYYYNHLREGSNMFRHYHGERI